MRFMQKYVFLVLCLFATSCFATSSNQAVVDVYQAWCKAIGSAKGNAAEVVKFYAPDAILLPTLSENVLTNSKQGGMTEYFVGLTNQPNIKCTPEKLVTRVYTPDFASNTGLYEFSYTVDGKTKKIPARFTFYYEKFGNDWLIVNHHSSTVPHGK